MSKRPCPIALTELELTELLNCISNSFQDEGELEVLTNGDPKAKAALLRAIDKVEKARDKPCPHREFQAVGRGGPSGFETTHAECKACGLRLSLDQDQT